MTIEFETPKPILQQQVMLKTIAENMMRSVSREFDENEHAIPWDYIEFMHNAMKAVGGGGLTPSEEKPKEGVEKRPSIGYQKVATQIEMLAWGDVGMYLITPGGGLGAAAVQAAGSPEQKTRFLERFNDDKPTYAAMCMTEPGAGSDTSSIRKTW
jgi:acyl-CoA dehydrogenase